MPEWKQPVKAGLRRLGYELIPASSDPLVEKLTWLRNAVRLEGASPPRALELLDRTAFHCHLRWLLSRYGINVVLDVGANEGQFAQGLRALGFGGPIVSFEPNSRCAASLRAQSAGDPRWAVHEVALGREPGRLPLTTFADSSFSSLRPPAAWARRRFKEALADAAAETVEVVPLDQLWATLESKPASPRALLKTDTQGYDLDVLQGAAAVLPICQVVIAEASFLAVYDGAPLYRELFAFLHERGFELSGLHPVSYREDRPSLIEADAVFVNAALS